MPVITLADGRKAKVRATVDTPVGRVRVDGPVRLVIDFSTAAGAVDFADMLIAAHPEHYLNSDAFVQDALDDRPGSTVFILKRATDRIPGTALREVLGFAPVVTYPMAARIAAAERARDEGTP
jgi:hypothetical protein